MLDPPPLPLTLHLSHLLVIYLAAVPCSLLCVVNGWLLVFITLIAGWCLLGLEALIGEVSGVFGSSGKLNFICTWYWSRWSRKSPSPPNFYRADSERIIGHFAILLTILQGQGYCQSGQEYQGGCWIGQERKKRCGRLDPVLQVDGSVLFVSYVKL